MAACPGRIGGRRAGRRSGATWGSAGTASSCEDLYTHSPASGCWSSATGVLKLAERPEADVGHGLNSSASRTIPRPGPSPTTSTRSWSTTFAPKALGAVVRAGAAAGAHAPPQLWRAASVPLTWALQRGGGPRPPLPVEVRRQLVEGFADDVHRLSTLTGEDFSDWLGDEGRGEFSTRAVGAAV